MDLFCIETSSVGYSLFLNYLISLPKIFKYILLCVIFIFPELYSAVVRRIFFISSHFCSTSVSSSWCCNQSSILMSPFYTFVIQQTNLNFSCSVFPRLFRFCLLTPLGVWGMIVSYLINNGLCLTLHLYGHVRL